VAPRGALGQDGRVAGRVPGEGKQIYVEGRLQTRQWDDKDGNKRYTTEIRGDRVVLLGGGGGGRAAQAARSEATEQTVAEPAAELTDDGHSVLTAHD